MKHLVGIVSVLMAAALISTSAWGDAEQGRELYVQKLCYSCHGYQGQGGAATVVLSPSPLDLEVFTAIIRRPYNVMPAYSPDVLSDREIESIFEYLESLPPPPDVESLPAFAD